MDITSVDKLYLAILFFIPGFVAMKVYSIVSASERLDASKAFVDALSFSCMIYAAFSWAILWARDAHLAADHPNWFIAFCVGLLFVAPTVSSLIFYRLRRARWVGRWLPHPVGKPWDFVFARRESFYVIIKLKSGQRIGGFYGGESFSSSAPCEEQIFIETVWDVDEDQGFVQKHVRSRGMLISGANIETIEFIGLEDDEQQPEASTGNGAGRMATAERLSTDTTGTGSRPPALQEHHSAASAAST